MKINLGCGPHVLEGFLNIDIEGEQYGTRGGTQRLNFDLSNGILPVKDYFGDWIKDVELIVSSHFLEHVSPGRMQSLIIDSYNRLIPLGQIRLCLPDFKKACKAYLDRDYEFFNLPEIRPFMPNNCLIEALQYGAHQNGEHKQVLDYEYMEVLLKKIGFINIKEEQFDPLIDVNNEARKRYSFYISAIKSHKI